MIFLKIFPLILIMSSVVFAKIPQKTQKEIIGQIDPFLSAIYIPIEEQNNIKILNEKNEELKYKIKKDILKIAYIEKPRELILKTENEIFNVKQIYPKSEINRKTYKDKNFNVFEIKNSYLYNSYKTEQGEYDTVILTDEVFLNIEVFIQPYKAITKNKDVLNGNIELIIYDKFGNELEKEKIKVYEEKEKINIPQKEIYHKKFTEPVNVKLKWKFELGAYETKIYDRKYHISFIKDIDLMLRCKDVENTYY